MSDARLNAGDERCPTCRTMVGTYRDFEGGRRYRRHSPGKRSVRRGYSSPPVCQSSTVEVAK